MKKNSSKMLILLAVIVFMVVLYFSYSKTMLGSRALINFDKISTQYHIFSTPEGADPGHTDTIDLDLAHPMDTSKKSIKIEFNYQCRVQTPVFKLMAYNEENGINTYNFTVHENHAELTLDNVGSVHRFLIRWNMNDRVDRISNMKINVQ